MKTQITIKEVLSLTALLFVAIQLTACSPSAVTPSQAIKSSDLGDSESIIGGTVVSGADSIAQSTVLLFDTQKGSICTGNVITQNLILTAAHCTQLHPEKIVAIFSTIMPQSMDDLKKMNWRRIVGGKTSEAWPLLDESKEKDWGDIAILKFDGALPAGYKAARLLSKKSSLRNGQSVTLAGFGITDGIEQTETEALRKVNVKIADVNFSSTELLMDQRSGRGACHGDSGGPALIKVGSSDVLIGVTSRGEKDPGDTCLQFSIYTSVAAHLDWIKKTAKELSSTSFKGGVIRQPAGI